MKPSADKYLSWLESEAIHIFRESVAELRRPCLLFSGGKDSRVLLRLAEKAFWPEPIPFPILHIDTGHNFPEVLEYRNRLFQHSDLRLLVASVQDSIDRGRCVEERGGRTSRNRLQTQTLLDAIAHHRFDSLFGGARRDEEQSRAKERIFSLRAPNGFWNPSDQPPELWSLYSGRFPDGHHFRIFPMSNWTELDVWEYIAHEKLELPSIYFAHSRQVFLRENMLLAQSAYLSLEPGEELSWRTVRYRTVGDMTCTGAVLSNATTVDQIISEVAQSTQTERGATRADDKFSETAMEDRKREGYF